MSATKSRKIKGAAGEIALQITGEKKAPAVLMAH